MKNKIQSIIKQTERYTRTDMVYLTKGSLWMGIGQLVTFASIIILSIGFANLVSPEVYGTYKYIVALAGILSIFSLPGMTTALARAITRGDEGTIHKAIKLRLFWSLIGSIVAICGSIYYYIQDNVTLSIGLGIIAIIFPFFESFTLYNSYLTGKRDFKRQSLFHLASQTISVCFLLLTLLLTDSVILLLLAYFIPLTIVRSFLFFYIVKKTSFANTDHETLKYGMHLSVINVLGIISSYTDTLLLWFLLGPQKVAIYTFALAIPEQIKGPLKSVSELAFPKFATLSPEQINQTLTQMKRKLFLYGLALLLISLIYVIAAPYIFELLFPQYLESVLYSQIFMLASIGLIGTIPISLLAAQKKLKEQYVFSTIQPVLQIAAFLILIPLYGIWGAIIARVIMRVFYASFSLYLMKKAFR